MKKAIGKHLKDFVAIIVIVLAALSVGGFVLANQRFFLPSWVPVVGTDFLELKAEFETAKSVSPGQGQTVAVAGVTIGEITKVEVKDGRAVVTMQIRDKYADMIKRDATMLLRPKTGLEDMLIQIDPGSPGAPRVPDGYTFPIKSTRPPVHFDEILSNLDRDTRDYLKLLISGGAQGLKDQGRPLSNTLRRLEPLTRDIRRITEQVARRRRNVARSIHNFQRLMTALGAKDQDLAELVVSANAVFESFARQEAKLRETVRELPSTLEVTRDALGKADELAIDLGPALKSLRPGARALAPSLREFSSFARKTKPAVKDQIRPFAREAQDPIKTLRPAARDLAKATPDLRRSFEVLNRLLNVWAYNPPGEEEGFLFYTQWAAHLATSVFSDQDANGPFQRGVVMTDCLSLQLLDAIKEVDAQLRTLIELLNPPTREEIC